jgi:ATP-dependent Clp protease ATP-binding subunit ClpA
MSAFGKYLKSILDQGAREARADRRDSVEAEHLLLAIATDPTTDAFQTLTAAGLHYQAIRTALDHEFEHSLQAVGMSAHAFDVPPASVEPDRMPALGATAKLAIERGMKSARRGEPVPGHLLLGILQAQVGTVPRALALAGVDRAELTARVLATLPG